MSNNLKELLAAIPEKFWDWTALSWNPNIGIQDVLNFPDTQNSFRVLLPVNLAIHLANLGTGRV